MPSIIPTVHDKCPTEMALVGLMLTDYGELEYSLMHCISVIRSDFDAVLKAMFRSRGETQRIDIGDALGRYEYEDLQLGTQFQMAIGAMRRCLSIRNQYAHCHWHFDFDRLCFIDLNEFAKTNDYIKGFDGIEFKFLSRELLRAQHDYFKYAFDCLTFINWEGRTRKKVIASNPFSWPKPRKPPDLHID
jgi:hypothetical protein